MTDIRVKYLKFVETRPLLFSSICTGFLCGASLCGLLLERNKICTPDLRLWLQIVIFRSGIRLLCRLYLAWKLSDVDRVMMRGDLHASAKCVDILDVFGIVWFAVGNLLVFNNFDCIGVSPIVFFSSLCYVGFSYLGFFLPSILRCSLGVCRPTHPDDVLYVLQSAEVEREVGMINLVGIAERGAGNPSGMYSPDLTPERSQFWKTWLEGYGCYNVSYHPSMNLREKGSSSSIGAGGGDAGGPTGGPTGGTASNGAASISSSSSGNNNGYTAVGTSAVADGDTAVDLESGDPQKETQTVVQAEGTGADNADYCSVCLLEFEGPPDSDNNGDDGNITRNSNTGDNNTNSSSGTANANTLVNMEEGGAAAGTDQTGAAGGETVEENNNIIVRYPCRGHHYFHAHCLHSWLQVASARYLNTRRGGRILPTEDHTLQVTCPCCREHPHSVLVEHSSNSSNSSGGGGGGGGGAEVTGRTTSRNAGGANGTNYRELIALQVLR